MDNNNSSSSRTRVKVYQLDSVGKWEDKGTGHVSTELVGSLIVNSEDDGNKILETKIFEESQYQRQQDTLIVWTDPISNVDLALSFQEPNGCQDIWDVICQMDMPSLELPDVSIDNLDSIRQIMDASNQLSSQKDKFVQSIVNKDYIKLLLDLFDKVEETHDMDSLHNLFHIFKNLILLNDTVIFETIFGDEVLIRIMGPLEYDPDISELNRIKHREFLKHNVIFKEVVEFPESNQTVVQLIHQTFKLQYLKDVVLPRILDDMTFATLNSIIYFNNAEIVTFFISSPSLISTILDKIETSESNSMEKRDTLVFFQELCGIAKGLNIGTKTGFFNLITSDSCGLFKTIKTAIDDENPQSRLSCAEILLSTLQYNAMILRNFITVDEEFLSKLISRFINDSDIGVKNQITEIIKILVESEPSDMSEFFKLFFEKGIYELVEPLNNTNTIVGGEPSVPGDPSSNLGSFVLSSVIELLLYCIRHHSQRIRTFIVKENITSKILKLTTSTEKYLALCAIRFLRCLVSTKDLVYIQHIINDNLFDPIIEIFRQNVNKYNLLNSAVLDLLNTIYKENIKDLLIYVVNRYRDTFESINYTDVMPQLITRFEQYTTAFESPEINCNNVHPLRNEREMDDEEERYFKDDSDDSDDELNEIGFNDGAGKQSFIKLQFIDSHKNNNNTVNNNNDNDNEKATTTSTTTTTTPPTKLVDYDSDEEDNNSSIEIDSNEEEEKTTTTSSKNDVEEEQEEEAHTDSTTTCKEPDETVCNGANHKDISSSSSKDSLQKESREKMLEEDVNAREVIRVTKRKSIDITWEEEQNNNNNDNNGIHHSITTNNNNTNGGDNNNSSLEDAKFLNTNNNHQDDDKCIINTNTNNNNNNHTNNDNNNNEETFSEDEVSSENGTINHRTIKRVKIKNEPLKSKQCAIVDSQE